MMKIKRHGGKPKRKKDTRRKTVRTFVRRNFLRLSICKKRSSVTRNDRDEGVVKTVTQGVEKGNGKNDRSKL